MPKYLENINKNDSSFVCLTFYAFTMSPSIIITIYHALETVTVYAFHRKNRGRRSSLFRCACHYLPHKSYYDTVVWPRKDEVSPEWCISLRVAGVA